MQLARIIPADRDNRAQQVLQCSRCRLALTEGAEGSKPIAPTRPNPRHSDWSGGFPVQSLVRATSGPEYFCTIRRDARRDGLHFWQWKVIDRRGWLIASGSVYTSRSAAIEKARAAMRARATVVTPPGRKAS